MGKYDLIKLVRGKLAELTVQGPLVVAVSGGVDSMVLLDILRQLYRGQEDRLTVVHVNHGLRPEAIKDEKLVADYCKKHGLALVVKQVNLADKSTAIEERARIARYEALREVAKKAWIVTAHTADDQVETVVGNWLRGSAVRGLAGMRFKSDGIVRPLLAVSKKQLLGYAKQYRLKFAVDKSNFDTKFTRNRIRHELLPILRKFNPQINEQLWQNSQIWEQVDLALVSLAKQYFGRIAKVVGRKTELSVSKLKELTPLMQVEVVKLALPDGLTGLTRLHFEELLKIVASPRKVVTKRRLGGKLFLMKGHDKITISQE